MCQSRPIENSGKIYDVDADSKMVTEPVMTAPNQDGLIPGISTKGTGIILMQMVLCVNHSL